MILGSDWWLSLGPFLLLGINSLPPLFWKRHYHSCTLAVNNWEPCYHDDIEDYDIITTRRLQNLISNTSRWTQAQASLAVLDSRSQHQVTPHFLIKREGCSSVLEGPDSICMRNRCLLVHGVWRDISGRRIQQAPTVDAPLSMIDGKIWEARWQDPAPRRTALRITTLIQLPGECKFLIPIVHDQPI